MTIFVQGIAWSKAIAELLEPQAQSHPGSFATPDEQGSPWRQVLQDPGSSSTRIKDAGIAIRHSRGYIISILQGLEMGWRGMKWCVHSQEMVKMDQFRPKVTKIRVSTF